MTMKRPLAAPSRNSFGTEGERSAYDRVFGHRAAIGHDIGPYFAALLHIPEIAEPLTALGSLWRQSEARGSVSNREREFASLYVAAKLGCLYVVKNHWPAARDAGITSDIVRSLLVSNKSLPPVETGLAALIDKVLAGTVSDDDFSALAGTKGAKFAVEFLTFSAYVFFSVRAIQALGIPQPVLEDVLASL